MVGRIVTQKRCSKNAEVLQRDSFGDLRQLPCSEKKLIVPSFHPFSCRQWFQVIFVMQTTQDRVRYHLLDHAEVGDLKFPAPECLLMVQVCLAPGRNADALVVMSHPFFENSPQVPIIQWNQEIQALTPNAPY